MKGNPRLVWQKGSRRTFFRYLLLLVGQPNRFIGWYGQWHPMFKFINCSRFVTLNWPLSPPSVYFNLFFFKNSRLILFTTGPIRFYSFRRSISLLNFLPFVPMFPANLALYLLPLSCPFTCRIYSLISSLSASILCTFRYSCTTGKLILVREIYLREGWSSRLWMIMNRLSHAMSGQVSVFYYGSD